MMAFSHIEQNGMIKALGVLSLLICLPVVVVGATTFYKSYYGPLADCSERQAAERDSCVMDIARNMQPATIEQIMSRCVAADRFMIAYEASPSLRKEYPQTPAEINALYQASCGKPGSAK